VTFWFVYSLKDAKVIRFEMFQDRDEALQAAGLSLSGPDTGTQYRGRDELRQFLETTQQQRRQRCARE
jgi:hypothetical protein